MKNKYIVLTCIVLLIIQTSCLEHITFIRGNGIPVTETRRSGSFNKIENSTAIDIIYKQADSISITIKTDENLLKYIVTETYNNTLEIKIRDGNSYLDFEEKPLITITAPQLEKVILSGSGDFIADNLSGDTVTIRVSGSGYISVDQVTCTDLDVSISGSGNINIKDCESSTSEIILSGSGNIQLIGHCEDGNLRISGSGVIFSEEFILKMASVNIPGSGNVFTSVENDLIAVISGSGNIYLKGNPTISQTISGSGRIIKYK